MRRLLAGLAVALASCNGAGRAPVATTLPPTTAESRPASQPASAPVVERDPWTGRNDLITAPAPAGAHPLALPPADGFTLPNGLRVRVLARHDVPLVSFRLTLPARSTEERREKRGLAAFAADMLARGSKRHSAAEIAEALGLVGASLEASADVEGTQLSCTVPARDAATCLSLLPELVVSPAFPAEEMTAVAQGLLARVGHELVDLDALAYRTLASALFGDGHVRGWPVTKATVEAITRQDLVDWHDAYFVPEGALLVVAGDVDAGRLRTQLGKAFSGWIAKKPPPARTYPAPVLKGLKIILFYSPDATQAHLALGHLGVVRSDPDFLACFLMNWTLGGRSLSSRLLKAVRGQSGRAYDAGSALENGVFVATTSTRTPEAVATLRLVMQEINRMRFSGPTAEELTDAKARIAGNELRQLQTTDELAAAVGMAELAGREEGYLRELPVKIAGVTLEQVKEAAKKHLDPDNMVVVIVGKADEIAPQLARAGLRAERR